MIQVNQSFEFMGYPVAYHEAGSGQAMIMLHNGGCSHIIWKQQIAHFQKNFRVIAFDLLGFGDSGRPNFPFTLEIYVEMLEAFIKKEGIEFPVLMGNCIGAAISLEYALRRPAEVSSLILCNICGGISMMKYFHPYMFPNSESSFPKALYKLVFKVSAFEWVKKKVIRRLYGERIKGDREIFDRLLNGLKHPMQPQSRIMLIKGLHSFNKFDHFNQGTSQLPPAIVFWGEKNKVLPLRRGKLLMDRLQPEECRVFSGEGHILMAEKPEQFNQYVARFLHAVSVR